jgi:hypothetical protein
MPFGAARWAGEKQHGQDYKWSGKKGQKKSAEKTQTAVDAAKSGESTEYYIDNGFEHWARPRP